MLTETGVVMVAAIVILVAFLSFTMGLLVRRGSDQDLIGQLEEELDRRQLVCPPEVAHEPAPLGEPVIAVVPADRLVMGPADMADTTWDMTPVPAGDLEIWTARLTVSNEEFLAGLFE